MLNHQHRHRLHKKPPKAHSKRLHFYIPSNGFSSTGIMCCCLCHMEWTLVFSMPSQRFWIGCVFNSFYTILSRGFLYEFHHTMSVNTWQIIKSLENCEFNVWPYFACMQIVLLYYPGHEMDAGRIGLCIVLAGMLGSVCCGIVLDKTHRFKWVKWEKFSIL